MQLSIDALNTTTPHLAHLMADIYIYVCVCVCDRSTFSGSGTGTLDRLADSHTLLALYPAHAIRYQRVVIHALLDTRF